ncbi:MAG: sulfotransferase [Bacteroidales bacterium]
MQTFKLDVDVEIKEISKLPFFFIIGRPRSGTTLLRTLLDAHPNVVIPQESPVILNLYRKYKDRKQWDRKHLEGFYKDLGSQGIFGVWNIDKIKLKNDLIACEGENTFENLIKVLYLNFNSIYQKGNPQIIGDKNPVYSYNFRSVFSIFPEAKFIHLTRDYRDQIVSMKRMDLEMSNPALVAYRWKLSVNSLLKFKMKYADRFYTLRYEDLVSDPENEIRSICSFLAVTYEESILTFHNHDNFNGFLPDTSMERYHSSLFNPIHSEKVNTWISKLRNDEVRIADWVVGDTAEKSGYKRQFDTISQGLKIKYSPYLFYGKAWNLGRQIMNSLPFVPYMIIRNFTYWPPVMLFKIQEFINKSTNDRTN